MLTAAADLRAGVVTSVQLVADSLLAVEKHDADLLAVVHLMGEAALAEAARCDAEAAGGRWRGPLHGIPVTVKDIIDVAGAPIRAGSAAYDNLPTADAVGVARLRAAGAIVLAKVSTHEFALGVTNPQSRKPHDPSRIPGGSSGGSAIAVSTGMGLASLGTDTRASIRVPAALSGVVGFKPTYGSVPTAGVVPLSWTMDHVAPITSSVADAALLVDVLTQRRTADRLVDRVGMSVAGLRVGVPEAAFARLRPPSDAPLPQRHPVEPHRVPRGVGAVRLVGGAAGGVAGGRAPLAGGPHRRRRLRRGAVPHRLVRVPLTTSSDIGNGPAVILVHGVGIGAWAFVNVAAALAADHRVLVPHRRGYGPCREGRRAGVGVGGGSGRRPAGAGRVRGG